MNFGYLLGNVEFLICCSLQSFLCGNIEMLSDEDFMLVFVVVYGFFFLNKQWGGFDVNGLFEIYFDDQVFDCDLVLMDFLRK